MQPLIGPIAIAAALAALAPMAKADEPSGVQWIRITDNPVRSMWITDAHLTAREFAALSRIRVEIVHLQRSVVDDEAWHHLARMDSIRNLVIDDTRISQEAVEAIGCLSRLRQILVTPATADHEPGSIAWSPLGRLEHLQSLAVLYGSWDDDALEAIAPLKSLTHLGIADVQITERGARALGSLEQLESLLMEGGAVSAEALHSFSGLHGLKGLTLRQTEISSSALRTLVAHGKLASLKLKGPAVIDEVLVAVGEMASLETLRLPETSVSDEGLHHLTSCEQLKALDLASTTVGDGGIEALLVLEGLEVLSLQGTQITDEGLARLAALPKLRALAVGESGVSEEGIESFRAMRGDVEIGRVLWSWVWGQ